MQAPSLQTFKESVSNYSVGNLKRIFDTNTSKGGNGKLYNTNLFYYLH